MWKMMKADIAYNGILFVILYSMLLLASLANAIKGNLEEQLATLMFFSVVVIGITAGVEEIKTKRIRFLAGLPMPVKRLALFRYSVFVPYWISLMVFLWISSLVSRGALVGIDYFWWILTRTAAVFIWIASMNLSQDIVFVYRTKIPGYTLKWVVLLIGVFGGPFVYFVTNFRYQSDPIFSFMSDIFSNPSGAMAIFLLSLSMIVVSNLVYGRRRSYTE